MLGNSMRKYVMSERRTATVKPCKPSTITESKTMQNKPSKT